MSLILNIETATPVCSVALFEDNTLLAFKENDDGYTHAENLHLFIEQILSEAGKDIGELAAIAVSKGPGSYTGLRIGTSTAKGLAFSLNIPLIGIDTLMIMAMNALQQVSAGHLCPMIDARRMEVYCAIFNIQLQYVKPVSAEIISSDSIETFASYENICFFGDGMTKCKPLLAGLPNVRFLDNCLPSARFMGELAYHRYLKRDFDDTAYFEPFYLKEFIAGRKKA